MTTSRRSTHRPAAVAALLAAAAWASPAAAQLVPRPAPTPARQTASINLLGLPFGFVSGEYERAVGTEGFAVGVGGLASFDEDNAPDFGGDNGYGNDRFASLQAKLKYYPTARGLRGFAIGLTAGVATARTRGSQVIGFDSVTAPGAPNGFYLNPRFGEVRASATRPTVGTVLDYNFLVGRRQRFLIGLGVGARRVLGSLRDDRRPTNHLYESSVPAPLDRTLFDGRLQIGVGF